MCLLWSVLVKCLTFVCSLLQIKFFCMLAWLAYFWEAKFPISLNQRLQKQWTISRSPFAFEGNVLGLPPWLVRTEISSAFLCYLMIIHNVQRHNLEVISDSSYFFQRMLRQPELISWTVSAAKAHIPHTSSISDQREVFRFFMCNELRSTVSKIPMLDNWTSIIHARKKKKRI